MVEKQSVVGANSDNRYQDSHIEPYYVIKLNRVKSVASKSQFDNHKPSINKYEPLTPPTSPLNRIPVVPRSINRSKYNLAIRVGLLTTCFIGIER